MGPFVDSTNGDTDEEGLTILQADVRVKKNGGFFAQKNEASACVHDEIGYYDCDFDATDTNTEGTLLIAVHEAGALHVKERCQVVNEAAYASWHTTKATGYMDINVKAMNDEIDSPVNLDTFWDDAGEFANITNDYDGDGYAGGTIKKESDVQEWNGTAVPADVQAGYPTVTIKDGAGVGEINTNGGAVVEVTTVVTTTTNTDMVGTNDAALASVLGAAVGASISADIADLPTVAEFEARSIVSADYVVVGDTIAGVTLVGTTTTNTDMRGTDGANTTVPDVAGTAATPAEVNAEVLDVMNVDTFAEPGDEAPTATTTLVDKIGYLYKFLRNKIETTANRLHIYDDAGANKDHSSVTSDDGTTFTRGEFGAGD